MINEPKANPHREFDRPRAANRGLTDGERDNLSQLWDAVPPWRARGKATGSSPEGKRLARRISALVASGVSLYEIASLLPLKYPSIAQLSAAGGTRRRRVHSSASPKEGPVTDDYLPANLETVEAVSVDVLFARITRDIEALRNCLPDYRIDFSVITRKSISP